MSDQGDVLSHEQQHHMVPLRVYFLVFIALLVGTFLTVWIAGIDLGMWNIPVALTIATIKATLVILFFMHVKYSGKLVWLVVSASFVWLLLLLFGIMMDPSTRTGVELSEPLKVSSAPMVAHSQGHEAAVPAAEHKAE